MANLNEREDAEERPSALYNNVKSLYEQAKLMWKGVLFEIQLDPIDPESEEQSERHTIDFRHCLPEFEQADNDDRHLTLDELFSEIERLQDYKSLLDSALQAIDVIREEYKEIYQVTFLRILQHPEEQPNEAEIESESEETLSEEEIESEEELEQEWEPEWESDSGLELELQDSSEESEYDSTWVSDSGLQTELESDIEIEPEWDIEPPFIAEHAFAPEHERQPSPFFGLNSDTDTDEEVSTSRATFNDSDEDADESDLEESYEYPKIDPNGEMLILGPNATRISKCLYEAIPWKSAAGTTGALLELIFCEDILATHTLNGRFNRWAAGANQLNPKIINDIISLICFKYNVSQKEVRNAIDSKCADARFNAQRKFIF